MRLAVLQERHVQEPAYIAGGIFQGCAGTVSYTHLVVFFNRMPGKWLCEYGKEPDEELAHPTRQRINSWPWKYFFSCLFVMASIKTAMDDPG